MNLVRLPHPVAVGTFLRHYVDREPLIIQVPDLAVLGWQTHRWTNDYLSYKGGAHEVRVLQQPRAGLFTAESASYVAMPFRHFIREVMAPPEGNPGYYLNLQTDRLIEPPLLQLIGDFSIPDYFKDFMMRCIVLWMGNSPSPIVTVLHHDFNDNLYVVVEGRKQFTLFPPTEAHHLYPRGVIRRIAETGLIEYEAGEKQPHLSAIDIAKPDFDRFPAYREALPQRIDLEIQRNEMLFLPAGWFHQVSSQGRHIALSFFAEVPSPAGFEHLRNLIRNATPIAREAATSGATSGNSFRP
jgi:mannose-6-phosphate isomerase-like protein (cupin superfamily)